MGQQPVDPTVARRFAELVGLGCTQHVAARAVGIGASTGERLLTKPEYRELAERGKQQQRTSLGGDLGRVVEELMTAEDELKTPKGDNPA